MSQTSPESRTTRHAGSCHCGAVRFEAEIDLGKGVGRCNCSICTKRGTTGASIKPSAFHLLKGEESLSDYQWKAKNAHFFFCKHCGIPVFNRGDLPEVGGAYVSVNVNCLDGVDPATLKVFYWDGRHDNWQAGPRSSPWPIG